MNRDPLLGIKVGSWDYLPEFLKAAKDCKASKSDLARLAIECGTIEAARLYKAKREQEEKAQRERQKAIDKITRNVWVSALAPQIA